ncbi:DUF7312 domain-containing protein [Natronorubrum tibetense]|uniref:DUF7312 domain-containing protein n=1 Tax=Natronorubrum tibetense GA33 TaxID=1114856 RepID=L9W0E9_9EURY|nr:hypothetical protein [Natronorubrum tibetense]ELY42964.1 hypothetical protein C496_06507 [Natronorubrum tibetense GA33]
MADDASGSDGENDRREPPAAPDGKYSDEETKSAQSADEWDTTASPGDKDRLEDNGYVEGNDRVGRPERTDDEYRVPLDLSDAPDEDETSADGADDADGDDPYAPEPSSTPIEPGDPSLENILFVILGAVAMLLVMFQIASIML